MSKLTTKEKLKGKDYLNKKLKEIDIDDWDIIKDCVRQIVNKHVLDAKKRQVDPEEPLNISSRTKRLAQLFDLDPHNLPRKRSRTPN